VHQDVAMWWTTEQQDIITRDKTISQAAMFQWFCHFKEGQQSLKDDLQKRRQAVASNKETTACVWQVIWDGHKWMTDKFVDALHAMLSCYSAWPHYALCGHLVPQNQKRIGTKNYPSLAGIELTENSDQATCGATFSIHNLIPNLVLEITFITQQAEVSCRAFKVEGDAGQVLQSQGSYSPSQHGN
jgi:hypothetical protein